MGTLVGVGVQGGFLDGKGHLPRAGKALSVDAAATVVGAALGTAPVATYVESASGIAAGARTGLASMVVVGGFCGVMFFAAVLTAVSPLATAPALIVVDGLMATRLARIEWKDRSEGIAAFVTVLAIPATFSISDGMAMGVCVYLGAKTLGGRVREISWIMWALGATFFLRYLLIPVA